MSEIFDCTGADLTDASFTNIDAREANFSGAILRGADFHGTDLRGADLQYADLRGADLRGATLHGAELRNARYDGTTRWPEGFVPEVAGCIDVSAARAGAGALLAAVATFDRGAGQMFEPAGLVSYTRVKERMAQSFGDDLVDAIENYYPDPVRTMFGGALHLELITRSQFKDARATYQLYWWSDDFGQSTTDQDSPR